MERAGKALAKIKLTDAISPEELARAAWPATVGKRIAEARVAEGAGARLLIVEVEDADLAEAAFSSCASISWRN